MSYSTNALRAYIRLRGFKEFEVAEKMGMTATTFSKKLNLTSVFGLDEALKLCSILNATLDELFLSDNLQLI